MTTNVTTIIETTQGRFTEETCTIAQAKRLVKSKYKNSGVFAVSFQWVDSEGNTQAFGLPLTEINKITNHTL